MYKIRSFIRKKISGGQVSSIVKNISWLALDRILRLGIGLLLGVLIARYLGPEKFGKWSYALALTSLLSAFATLGLDNIIIKDLLQCPEKRNEILGTTFLMRFAGGVVTILTSTLIVLFTDTQDTELLICVAIISIGFIFQSFDVIDSFFQSKVQSRYVVIAKNGAFVFCAVLKSVALWRKADFLVFITIGTFEIFLSALGLVYFYYSQTLTSIKEWYSNRTYLKKKLKECWPLLLSGLVIMIYMRIDQIMLKQILGEKSVGIYSAAVRISEVSYFLYTILSASVYPALIKARNNNNKEEYLLKVQRLFDYTVVIALATGLFFTISSNWVINILFGPGFEDAAAVLKINIWCGVFVALGVASSQYLILEGLAKLSFYRSFAGALVNLLLNFVLIPIYGISGAALSTLIAQFTAAYIFDLFNKKTRQLFFMKTRSVFLISLLSKV
ncbi:MAG: Polysaccharide biosynthesis protein [Segetibacter sp.]|nr:Polysaccharide biosynthesis protein [Segetibacter sp.]